ncbi:MAG: VWA domain-containing protein [Pyrinomonadaceae bacterium]
MVDFAAVRGQTASPSPITKSKPTPPPAGETQEPLKVFTEEVLIPIFVLDENNRFDPTLEKEDLLLFEDNVLQEIRSVRREPSSVLLLLDTAGEKNPAMKTNITREIASHLVSNLRTEDRVAGIQFGDRVETIQGWTTQRERVIRALRTKLFSGKRSLLVDGLMAGAAHLRQVPAGGRHVVLITDGVTSSADKLRLAEAIMELLGVHATVHVISYTTLGRKVIQRQNPLVVVTNEKRKSAQDIANEIMYPNEPWEEIRRRKIYVIVDTDIAMRRQRDKYEAATKESERWLASLADQTGGMMALASSEAEMIKQGELVAREIDSQYVVAYRPKRPLAMAAEGEFRSIKVATRRGGVRIQARKGYVTKPGKR